MLFVRVVEELSVDEAVIPLRGKLHMQTYNPGKLAKYGLVLVGRKHFRLYWKLRNLFW
jgi:hypothetical protein